MATHPLAGAAHAACVRMRARNPWCVCMSAVHVLMCVVCAVFSLDEEHEHFKFDFWIADGISSFGQYAEDHDRLVREILAVVRNSHGRIFPRNVPRSMMCKKDKHHRVLEHATIDTVPAEGMRFMVPPSAATKAYLRNKIALITYEV